MFYAHSLDGAGKERWQELPDHLAAVARLAEIFGREFGAGRLAALAGLLHDLGKFSIPFQRRLEGAGDRVDHSTAGASVAFALSRETSDPWARLLAQLVGYAIAGHHAGLPDHRTLVERLAGSTPPLDECWRDLLSPDVTGLNPELRSRRSLGAFQLAFLARMVFSCLVDADFRDTEAFYAAAENAPVDRAWPALGTILPSLIARFESRMAAKQQSAPEGALNRRRAEIFAHVVSAAPMPKGVFTLTVPTGGGKTLASLGFALRHAAHHGLSRIVYAVPFTSVCEQTAAIFQDFLGKDVVLEHHSAIEEEKPGEREQRDKLRLAMEDWAAPVVVTTNVQLFESLFANRPSRCRKLHNLANSVIILDEAQCLPLSLMRPAVAALDELARNYGVSIVLCTATQPAVDARNFPADEPMGLALEGRELAPDPEGLARELRRVRLTHVGTLDDEALVAALRETPQGLVIVNSRRHALALFRRAVAAGLDGVLHLSTRHYAAHRREILTEVRRRLVAGEPCRLVATSLVEAGVDVDFPRVWRAEAGLDQIAQAAGRCNREGRRPVEESIVSVFQAPDDPPPREIRQLVEAYGRVAARHADHLSPAAIADYFGEVYWVRGRHLDAGEILGMASLDRSGFACDYEKAAAAFRMIDSVMVPVIIPRGPVVADVLARLEMGRISAGVAARKLQSFLVLVPAKARALLLAKEQVRFAAAKTFGSQFAILQNETLYRKETGLLWEDAEYLTLEQSNF